jgi:hypothetical protein
MPNARVSDLLLHNFPENGVTFLLHNPGNLRDLLTLLAKHRTDLPRPQRFDFERRDIQPDMFIRGDFSHGVTDLLVRLPFRDGELTAAIQVYLLIEHLSQLQQDRQRLREMLSYLAALVYHFRKQQSATNYGRSWSVRFSRNRFEERCGPWDRRLPKRFARKASAKGA